MNHPDATSHRVRATVGHLIDRMDAIERILADYRPTSMAAEEVLARIARVVGGDIPEDSPCPQMRIDGMCGEYQQTPLRAPTDSPESAA